MKDDVAVLITRAETKGVAFRLTDGNVEVFGIEDLPSDLLEELRSQKNAIAQHLSEQKRLVNDSDVDALFAWASALAEKETTLNEAICYIEAPQRTINTVRVSWYAVHYLRIISSAHIENAVGGWGMFTAEWWSEREQEAISALTALKEAMAALDGVPPDHVLGK